METHWQAVLDHWEEVWTRPRKNRSGRTIPAWMFWLSPDLSLKPSEPYEFRLYLQMVSRQILLIFSLILSAYCAGSVTFWRNVPARKGFQSIFQHPHAIGNAQAITFFYGFVIFLLVVFPLFLAIILSASLFPRYYFWNRRFARTVHEETFNGVAVAEDKTIWPPPPQPMV